MGSERRPKRQIRVKTIKALGVAASWQRTQSHPGLYNRFVGTHVVYGANLPRYRVHIFMPGRGRV